MYDCCEYNYTVLEKNAHFPNNYLNTQGSFGALFWQHSYLA